MLFNKNWEEWTKNKPEILPVYSNSLLSAYKFGDVNKNDINFNSCFAPELIHLINKTPNQELATHTYSHYYCLEQGQNIDSFKSDLQKNIEIAKNSNIELRSLVFPRNQFNEEYLKVCMELGIKNVRSNPENWYWNDTSKGGLLKKIFRTGDAYLGAYDKSYSKNTIAYTKGQPLAQKASRLLRPSSKNKFINNLKLIRIKQEMEYAAKNNEVYHLWWHPHNFGNNPESNLLDLQKIINYYHYCNKKYNFQSKTMEELGEDFFNLKNN